MTFMMGGPALHEIKPVCISRNMEHNFKRRNRVIHVFVFEPTTFIYRQSLIYRDNIVRLDND